MDAPDGGSGLTPPINVNEAVLTSIRPNRSRSSRPCDRCRSRKQRCVIPKLNEPCLNCTLSEKSCTFHAPPEPRFKVRRTETTSSPSTGSASGPSVSPAANFELPPTAEPPAAVSPQRDLDLPDLQSLWPVDLDPTPLPVLPAQIPSAGLSDLLAVITMPGAIPDSCDFDDEEDDDQLYLSLDLESGHDEELCLVGTASESDALVLSMLVTDALSAAEPAVSPELKMRHVSRDLSNPVTFLYHVTRPYQEVRPSDGALNQMLALVGQQNIHRILQHYLQNDGLALPIWSQDHFASETLVNEGLHCCYIASGLIYDPALSHLHHEAWKIVVANTAPSPLARLSSVQATLIDINGRCSRNPSGNFKNFATAIGIARLLGLHLDCSRWTIPRWERRLRTRIWWALIIYDTCTALSFGRDSLIHNWNVPLPSRSHEDSPPYHAFVALSELCVILGRFLPLLTSTRHTSERLQAAEIRRRLAGISSTARELDRWRASTQALFNVAPGDAAPGVCSLELQYLGSAVQVARAAWDTVALHPQAGSQEVTTQRACLQTATNLVNFVERLDSGDFKGYWSSNSPFLLSSCLVVLVRLTHSIRSNGSER
ncbi:hypothetical protein T439DRAFT_325021 [Meredithblackwellia eburnea MCA 4105]